MTQTNTTPTSTAFLSFTTLLHLALSLVILFFLHTLTSHAATLQVAAGNDETTVNSTCSLSEAITNINNGDATSYPECTSTNADPFGTDDTIELPTGTITLTADLPQITESITIVGQGMGESVVDGDGQYGAILCVASAPNTMLQVSGMKVTGFELGAPVS